jgi:hypothetical protein
VRQTAVKSFDPKVQPQQVPRQSEQEDTKQEQQHPRGCSARARILDTKRNYEHAHAAQVGEP